MKRPLVFTVAICFVLICESVSGGIIIYSWNGTIEPLDANVDPWNIGLEKPYFVSITVDEKALDGTAGIDIAAFGTSDIDVVFLIDGTPPTSLGRRNIAFFDQPSRDDISIFIEDVVFNGVRETFYPFARLPISTFTFTRASEPPPVFKPAMTFSRSGFVGLDSSYVSFAGPGVTVTAIRVPKPSTLVLALLALSVLGTRCFWRKLVCAR